MYVHPALLRTVQGSLLLQALQERNATAHAIWLVAAITGAVLGVMVLIGVVDWLRAREWRRRPDEGVETGASPTTEKQQGVSIHEPDTRLRRRFFRRIRPRRRTWSSKEG